MNDFSTNYSTINPEPSRGRFNFSKKRIRRYLKRSTILPFAVVGVIVLVIGIVIVRNATSTTNAVSVPGMTADNRVDIEKAKKQQKINKIMTFPLKDQAGKEVSKYTYEVQNVELRDEIIVKGERAISVKGRTFLIVNLKITNNFDRNITLNVKDFLRLSVNNSTEKLAPDIHNDPVDIQAISTKYTRVGFPINDTDKNLLLQIGEISGSKETIKLDLWTITQPKV